jgi:hypothetical protein
LSLELLTTSITMFKSSGGLSPAGRSLQKFMMFFSSRGWLWEVIKFF